MRISPKLRIGIKFVLLVIILLAILNSPFTSKKVKNFFYFISSPVQKSFWKAGDKVSDFFEAIIEIENLKKENEELKLKNQELLAENTKIPALERDNTILREALGVGLKTEFKLVYAEVTGKDISQDSILIDKGSKNGISENLSVINQQKVLIGKVKEIYENFSRVVLISDKESIFNVEILRVDEAVASSSPFANARVDKEGSVDSISGVIKGNGNFQLTLDLIPKEKEIKEGDNVITSSLGGVFPQGLLVGQVQKIRKSDAEPFQQAEIKPAFDIKELGVVFIVQ